MSSFTNTGRSVLCQKSSVEIPFGLLHVILRRRFVATRIGRILVPASE